MKTIIKSNIFIAVVAGLTTLHAYGNGLIENNKTAYELTALAAYEYLNYTYQGGATALMCSPQGKALCRTLGNLAEKIRLFSHPARDDLKELSKQAVVAFRDFDYTGKASDRTAFVQSLINLLKAALPLLEGDDFSECRSLIQQLSQ